MAFELCAGKKLKICPFMTPQMIAAAVFGATFVIALIVLAIAFPKPTSFQYGVFRIVLSLAVAGVAAMIPGFIDLKMEPGLGVVIRAGGALAIFVVVYFFNPAQLAIKDSDSVQQMEQVAAICYRLVGDSIQFLLVKTTGGRWTFPKGGIEPGEEKWFSAKREAFEEAGASGEIEHEPLTTYLHEKKEWKSKGMGFKIHAFLLRVDKTEAPEEKHRTPTWFSPVDAEAALRDGRTFKYQEELASVIRAATERLSRSRISNPAASRA